MHGGIIYVRGQIEPYMLGRGLHLRAIDERDRVFLNACISDYARDLGISEKGLMDTPFLKITPASHRPYGSMYAY